MIVTVVCMLEKVNALATRKRPRAGQPRRVIAMKNNISIDLVVAK